MNGKAWEMPIESFTIKGLHGYKDISIEFAGKATVIVAENGSGKTTLLNALNAFLTRRFHRLSSLAFSSIECKFKGELIPLVFEKAKLDGGEENWGDSLRQLAEESRMPDGELLDFLQNTYEPGQFIQFQHNSVVRQVYLKTNLDLTGVEKALDDLYSKINRSFSVEVKAISSEIRRVLTDVEVVYLPTYRRIERPLLRTKRSREGRPLPGRNDHSLRSYDDMAFGLADVQERLVELSEEIERSSNLEYRSLSAKILHEMLKGSAQKESVRTEDLPDIDSLSRFLGRVGRNVEDVFQDIGKLYKSGEIEANDNWFLRYFLSRLGRVIEKTREMELKVERFVTVCNSYLKLSSDEKLLTFDPQTLRVVVQDQWANRPISLDDLSSGEKQIISLMARLYLSDKQKIVLIDEPELSLSLDWQRKVLPDIIKSEMVVQLLAITHSPFIFENELDSCARSLKIQRSEASQ